MTDLSLIILSYNSKSDLQRLLPGVFASEGVDFAGEVVSLPQFRAINSRPYVAEAIIVDNGSTDGTAEWLEQELRDRSIPAQARVRIVKKNTNSGFAAGVNQGLRQAKGRYLLILNPDTQLHPDTFRTMIKFMDDRPDVGISTCKVLLPDGRLDLACRRRFPNPWNSFKRLFLLRNRDYNYTDVDENQSIEIDSCMGAFLLARRDALESVKIKNSHTPVYGRIEEGADAFDRYENSPENSADRYANRYFDEDFFMYGEDLDLCWRVKEAGYKIWYYPKTTITHYKGSSSRKVAQKALRWFYDAMWIFYKKHYRHRYWPVFNWLVWLGIRLKLYLTVAINFLRKEKFVSKR